MVSKLIILFGILFVNTIEVPVSIISQKSKKYEFCKQNPTWSPLVKFHVKLLEPHVHTHFFSYCILTHTHTHTNSHTHTQKTHTHTKTHTASGYESFKRALGPHLMQPSYKFQQIPRAFPCCPRHPAPVTLMLQLPSVFTFSPHTAQKLHLGQLYWPHLPGLVVWPLCVIVQWSGVLLYGMFCTLDRCSCSRDGSPSLGPLLRLQTPFSWPLGLDKNQNNRS